MSRITVQKLIEILQTFDPDLEVWTSSDVGYFPMNDGDEPRESILEDFNIYTSDYEADVGMKIVKFN